MKKSSLTVFDFLKASVAWSRFIRVDKIIHINIINFKVVSKDDSSNKLFAV
jgi:hypothetical protein